MKFNHPKNRTEFQNLMEKIDNKLRQKNIPIFARPIHAIREAALLFKENLQIAPKCHPLPGDYRENSLSAHIQQWYEEKYGDRLIMEFSPGSAAIIIRGDPWLIKFPLVYGKNKLVFDPNLEKHGKEDIFAPAQNPLKCIQGFTTNLARSLSRSEMARIAAFFVSTLKTLQGLVEIKNLPYIHEAREDLKSAVNHIFSNPPHFGQSKWSSLQFTEKTFKCYLNLNSVSFPKTHDLEFLNTFAKPRDLITIPENLTKIIKCKPDVRYGEIDVTLNEAINAHHASLNVCYNLIPHIKKSTHNKI